MMGKGDWKSEWMNWGEKEIFCRLNYYFLGREKVYFKKNWLLF